MTSWISIPDHSDFSLHNIPFGLGDVEDKTVACTRIGDTIINLHSLAVHGLFKDLVQDTTLFNQSSLNALISTGKHVTNGIRSKIKEVVTDPKSPIKSLQGAFFNLDQVNLRMPVEIGDYTDFYSSIEHATNVGRMFRDPANALLPNWRHIPIGYHGRASSIVISGTPIHRPNGQTKLPDADLPVFGPTKRLDFELEIGFIIGKDTKLGDTISTNEAEDYIFGLVLFNDWSARDVQQWEYVPLGPFLSKNFASAMSPWIVPLEALDTFRTSGPEQIPAVLPYLEYEGRKNYDLNLEVILSPENGQPTTISKSNFKYMYWNMCQQLAHHTSNGCNVRVGDLMASGTISGPDAGSLGSMLEMTLGGKQPMQLPNSQLRSFVEDGDSITIKGWGEKNAVRVGFGEVMNKVLPAR